MSWATAVVLIVLISAIARVVAIRHGGFSRLHKRDRRAIERGTSPREAELQHEVEDLRERIKVLEKITVDDRSAKQIADEIEKLRD